VNWIALVLLRNLSLDWIIPACRALCAGIHRSEGDAPGDGAGSAITIHAQQGLAAPDEEMRRLLELCAMGSRALAEGDAGGCGVRACFEETGLRSRGWLRRPRYL